MKATMNVCDFCKRPVNGEVVAVKIGDKDFSEVCPACVQRLGTFVKKLGTPHVSQYAKKKAKAEAAKAGDAPAAQTTEPKDGKPAIGFGRKK